VIARIGAVTADDVRTVARTLFTQPEIAQMQRLAKALETITYKPPNASGSGYTAAGLASQFFGTLLNALGMKSVPARMLMEYSGAANKYGAAQASRAVSDAATPSVNLGPFVSPVGSTYERNARDRN